MLEELVAYLGIAADDAAGKAILSTLIRFASAAFEDYTGQAAEDYETIIMKMVIEDWNRYGSEGLPSFSFGSNTESILTDYSDGLKRQMRRLKKVRMF